MGSQIDVYTVVDGEGYIALDHDTGAHIARLIPEPNGWWRVRLFDGKFHGIWAPGATWEDVMRRIIGA